MQIQGTQKSWSSAIVQENIGQEPGTQMYSYYSGMFQAGRSIWRLHGLKGLYAGYVYNSAIVCALPFWFIIAGGRFLWLELSGLGEV